MPAKQRCQGEKADGEPCRAWPAKGTSYCIRHQPPERPSHGFYGRTYTAGELADLVALAADDSLEDEIGASKVALRRIIEYLDQHQEQLDSDEYGRLAGLVFAGSATVAKLLRTRYLLEGGPTEGLTSAIAGALDQISSEWNIDL